MEFPAYQPSSHRQNWTLPPQLEADYWRGMDTGNSFRDATTIHIPTSTSSDSESDESSIPRDIDRHGDPEAYQQGCHKDCDRGGDIPQYYFHSSQEELWSPNDSRPTSLQLSPDNFPLQDGEHIVTLVQRFLTGGSLETIEISCFWVFGSTLKSADLSCTSVIAALCLGNKQGRGDERAAFPGTQKDLI